MTEKKRYHSVRVKSERQDAIARRHPWVFSGALVKADLGGLEPGDLVDLTTFEGNFLARGYYERGSIAVRILAFSKTEIDASFWLSQFSAALQLRHLLGLTTQPSDAYRLVNAEGDGVPGLIIDVYAGVAVVQTHTEGMHRYREELFSALQELYGSQLRAIYYKPEIESALKYEGLQYGSLQEDGLIATEGELRFSPDIKRGQKTGYFLDQRDNRALVRKYSKGRKVLNMFSYTGGFTVAALRGGAERVVSVDSSARAIQLLERHVSLNFDEALIASKHRSEVADAFSYLQEMPEGEYDLIVLDPPAFAKRRSVINNALKGYRKINADAMRKIASGGLLFTFSCSQVITTEVFRQNIFTAALQAGRNVRVLDTLYQALDHPVSIYHPEGGYLKGLLLYVE